MVIHGFFGTQIDAKTKDIVLDIAPSAPYGVVAIQDVNQPVVRLMWALDPHSAQDNLTIKLCRGKQFSCPEKTILITPEEDGKFPLNYTLDATDFVRDDIYTVTMISMSGPLTSSDSVPTDISPYTLCEHPEEVHGTLVSSEGDAIWFFVSSREYTLQCLDGYVPPVGGAIWECDDEAWVRGDDCVIPVVASSSTVLIAVGLGVATVLLLIIGLSVACTKISRGKRIAVQTPDAVVDNVREDLAVKAAKLHRGNVQASYGNMQASYGNVRPSYGNVRPSLGNVQPSNQAMGTYGQSKLSSSRLRNKTPVSRQRLDN